jgi:fermentation-respiration switch protein FrsA (DUF1100 family)
VLKILSWIAVIYAGYCLLLFLAQRHMLFPRYLIPEAPTVEHLEMPYREIVWIETSFGKVETWFFRPQQQTEGQPSPVVIFAHGNAERIEFCVDELAQFLRWGINVLLVEFPGYGRSAGKPTQTNLTETFVTAYDLMTQQKDVDSARIILYGRSIGGGAICSLLNERPSAAVILMSTFSSVRSFAPRYLVPPFLVRDPFDNLSVIRNYHGPLLILHGKQDEVIPYAHGKRLFDASSNARLISYDCGHNDCPPEWREFWKEVEHFLRQAGIL